MIESIKKKFLSFKNRAFNNSYTFVIFQSKNYEAQHNFLWRLFYDLAVLSDKVIQIGTQFRRTKKNLILLRYKKYSLEPKLSQTQRRRNRDRNKNTQKPH